MSLGCIREYAISSVSTALLSNVKVACKQKSTVFIPKLHEMDSTPDDISATGSGWLPMDPTVMAWVEARQAESLQWTTWTTPEGHTVRCDRNIHAQQAFPTSPPSAVAPNPAIEDVRAILTDQ